MPELEWPAALVGGAMIGSSAVCLFRLNGRIAGISGMLGDLLLNSRNHENAWRFAFLAGLVIGCLIVRVVDPSTAEIGLQTGWPGMILAGLLVGFGTRMSCGCTSGHGICGIARASPRSIVATLVGLFSAMLTVAVLRHTEIAL